MKYKRGIIIGLVIIVVGVLLLADQFFNFQVDLLSENFALLILGAILLLLAIFAGRSGLAVPGCILIGIGVILLAQDLPGFRLDWSYSWTLIPGFVGIGVILSGWLDRRHPHFERGGLVMIVISLVAFFMLSNAVVLGVNVSQYWPVLLILAGVVVLVNSLSKK